MKIKLANDNFVVKIQGEIMPLKMKTPWFFNSLYFNFLLLIKQAVVKNRITILYKKIVD